MKKETRIYNGKKTASSLNGAGKTRQLHAKESNGLFSHTMHKNTFKSLIHFEFKT